MPFMFGKLMTKLGFLGYTKYHFRIRLGLFLG